MRPISFIKLGGSLITDKRREKHARKDVIRRLAGELAELRSGSKRAWVVGHGSGSFGHVEAQRHGVHLGASSKGQLEGLAATAHEAARLHRMVVAALVDAGTAPFSWAPSSSMVSTAGAPASVALEPFTRALDLGLVPVVYGDVVMDRERGCAICSTETVFTALIEALQERGRSVERVYWLGETEGIYDADGRTIDRIDIASSTALLERIEGAAGTDVTGGIRHRLATAVALARIGVESWVGNGLEPGRLRQVVEGTDVPGTWVLP